MTAFEPIPLDRSTRQIRLLRFVDSDAATTPISCRLDSYDLDNCPSFFALSYTWGDVHQPQEISLNGEVFLVRQNLHSALLMLREDTLKHESRRGDLYWIDAICINQQDDSERSHQVNMMGTIYSVARLVLVWLGSGDADSDKAMRKWADCYGDCCDDCRDCRKEFIRHSVIAGSAYWERMWVIQEFTLAKDLLLLRGRWRLSWKDLNRTLGSSFEDMNDTLISRSRQDAAYRLVIGRRRWEQRSPLTTSDTTLESLITIFKSSKCSDIRDRVYALLSLVQTRSDDSKPLYPDYTISPRQLYYRVLGNVRHSPALRTPTDWDTFRAELCELLVIPRDEDFERNDLLYRASEHERPYQKPLLSLHPERRIELGHAFLKDVADYLTCSLADMHRHPQRTYTEVVQTFQSFPKEDDPEAWECFDNLLKEALGLWSTTSEDSETWNMFINFQE